jgi:hypothetical protein
MKKEKKVRAWLWVLLLVVLAGLAYYLYSQKAPEPEKRPVIQKPPAAEQKTVPQKRVKIAKKEEKPSPDLPGEETPPTGPPGEDEYSKIEKDVADFFHYLDQKEYIKKMDLKVDTYTRFKRILKRLAARQPVPAGEGKDPNITVANIYHFFRAFKDDKKDLQLFRGVIRNEHDNMEYTLQMFYTWLTLGPNRPDPEGVRPAREVLYRYAGFFLNTTGGMAYLFRRPGDIRLPFIFYCLLVVHHADKEGMNTYGIDIVPQITRLKKEMGRYSDLQLHADYLKQLNHMEDYYRKKRGGR